MTKEEEKYLFWLTSLSGLGLPFVQRFFERYKSIDTYLCFCTEVL